MEDTKLVSLIMNEGALDASDPDEGNEAIPAVRRLRARALNHVHPAFLFLGCFGVLIVVGVCGYRGLQVAQMIHIKLLCDRESHRLYNAQLSYRVINFFKLD